VSNETVQVADRETDEDAGEAQPHPSLGVEGVSPALLGGQLTRHLIAEQRQ